ncbi:uncharacterized protein LOC102463496 [Pelodiscus sinensis]|uniref:uncharacterized protein LOC102463496 n=1 Tax=Pelodiscus sinensis TaxID=13735 RepID=UPI0003C4697D|nr:uncharacterized protein LOC102463496 [Pelodiscus sinensis]XP_006131601.1 uncharacterized protein LOC102463496 [Pelodiscus sinensis]XP_014433237.1 uncharacterized protein LOC102463496 [Pelodiscus sinensis]XP_014433239.1 uncharacterized protein LOC102463496 [Pelodiscus sinensis]XP_014433240.1 uncharacterized protein LOC102463496 [Pelodiscus sinensis]XP_014433241.1 uncharacterized protein LOC102463496 [Pelodiscus sinensis]XP_014433242.1 uncharacterized protein LOC102463496 [Pelodiscus sinensi|eukprot:XP_006131598.1 uncharacterized protein LOC102463496 [Pelodiscus sinensis]
MSNEEDEDKTYLQEIKQEAPTPSTSSATPPKKRRRMCHYNSNWENQFSWVVMDHNDKAKVRCKLCNASLIIAYDGVKALTQHANSTKHVKNVQAAAAFQRMSSLFLIQDSAQSEQVTVAELTHIYHGVKHHISFLAQDCSVKVMKQVLQDSEIVKKMTAGRTKASAVVNNVLYPFSIELLLNDLKNCMPFSVATDASNKGNHKFFPVAVQYFTPQEGLCFKILDFYENAFEDSQSIKDQLCHVLNEKGLSWTNVSAYGVYNSSMNYGVNNSVFQKLAEQENENIIAAHCINHILHNCAKYALKVLSFDIENLVLKVFAEFSNSAEKPEELKDFFEFCEVEFHEVMRNVPTRWLSLFNAIKQLLLNWRPLKAYFLSLGSDDCHVAIWNIISDQEDEMASDEQPTLSELYLYFTHYFMSQFQDTLLKLENQSTLSCDLYLIMEKFRNSLRKKIDDKFFGMKITFALGKDQLPVHVVNKFTSEALNVYTRALKYLEKWFPFENSPYCALSALSLANREKSPSFDEIIQIWMMSPWKKELPPNSLYEEVCALDMMFTSLEGTTSLDKWKYFFSKEPAASNLLKLVQYSVSIPVSNAGVERIFSVMGNLWTDERNRLSVESVRSQLCVFFNIPFTCLEAKDEFLKNKKLINAAQSNVKYTM